ncbi:hypothetical protein JD844_014790 [Phrynosoma platyrhinos]|uniref:Major facilitator superfamily (MFS) profile domain-containing protein n=1 Tax=Phrynosoma platyrhinos TaxID=52577 RepID=A0ABQ7SRZ8_PHRPL|nr:hypothetical protein JD844_014790 [Phrynosoma platyrhinos]
MMMMMMMMMIVIAGAGSVSDSVLCECGADHLSWAPYLSMGCIFAYILSFGIGPAGVTGIIPTEIFDQVSRPAAYMVSGSLLWTSLFLVGTAFPFIVGQRARGKCPKEELFKCIILKEGTKKAEKEEKTAESRVTQDSLVFIIAFFEWLTREEQIIHPKVLESIKFGLFLLDSLLTAAWWDGKGRLLPNGQWAQLDGLTLARHFQRRDRGKEGRKEAEAWRPVGLLSSQAQHCRLLMMILVLGFGGNLLIGFQVSVIAYPSQSILCVCCRKKSLMWADCIVIAAALLIGFSKMADSFEMILAGRLSYGIAAGICLNATAPYLLEISPKKLRGFAITMSVVFFALGKVLGQIMGLRDVLGGPSRWPLLLGLSGIPALLQLLLLPLFPESPAYLLLQKGDKEGCLRGNFGDHLPWLSFCSVALIFLFIIFFGVGPSGAVFSVVMELFNQYVRPPALVVIGCVSWLGFFLSGLGFPFLVESLGYFCFLIFLAVDAGMCTLVYFFLPETKGKSVVEITSELNQIRLGPKRTSAAPLSDRSLCTKL